MLEVDKFIYSFATQLVSLCKLDFVFHNTFGQNWPETYECIYAKQLSEIPNSSLGS